MICVLAFSANHTDQRAGHLFICLKRNDERYTEEVDTQSVWFSADRVMHSRWSKKSVSAHRGTDLRRSSITFHRIHTPPFRAPLASAVERLLFATMHWRIGPAKCPKYCIGSGLPPDGTGRRSICCGWWFRCQVKTTRHDHSGRDANQTEDFERNLGETLKRGYQKIFDKMI